MDAARPYRRLLLTCVLSVAVAGGLTALVLWAASAEAVRATGDVQAVQLELLSHEAFRPPGTTATQSLAARTATWP